MQPIMVYVFPGLRSAALLGLSHCCLDILFSKKYNRTSWHCSQRKQSASSPDHHNHDPGDEDARGWSSRVHRHQGAGRLDGIALRLQGKCAGKFQNRCLMNYLHYTIDSIWNTLNKFKRCNILMMIHLYVEWYSPVSVCKRN
jgi:hypothetical protein